jgi:hypothetical protein
MTVTVTRNAIKCSPFQGMSYLHKSVFLVIDVSSDQCVTQYNRASAQVGVPVTWKPVECRLLRRQSLGSEDRWLQTPRVPVNALTGRGELFLAIACKYSQRNRCSLVEQFQGALPLKLNKHS